MARNGASSISVVVPVFNSAQGLPELVLELERVLRDTGRHFELLLINDGSQDGSWEVIRSLKADHDWIVAVNLLRNFGQHNALLCGIRLARHDLVVTLDDDLQHPPDEIPQLLAHLEDGEFDVVYGPPLFEQHGVARDLASIVTKRVLAGALGAETAAFVSPFRVMRTEVRTAFTDFDGPFVNIDVLLTWGTTRFGFRRVRHERRKYGRSSYDFWRLVGHAMNMLTGFSALPLRAASLVGFATAFMGALAFAWVVGRYLVLGYSVPGFPFLAASLAVFSGAQLIALGIIGEYLARLHFHVLRRPAFVIRDIHKSAEKR